MRRKKKKAQKITTRGEMILGKNTFSVLFWMGVFSRISWDTLVVS